MSGGRTVRGRIVLPPDARPSLANVIVQVEDVSRADAPSEVVAEMSLMDVTIEPEQEIDFELEIPEERVDESHRYSVRVHVDASCTGEVELGDLVSTQSHPVLTGGFDEPVIPVRQL